MVFQLSEARVNIYHYYLSFVSEAAVYKKFNHLLRS